MPGDKPLLVSRLPSEDRFDEMPDQIPAVLLNALFAEESTGRKLPRAVMVGEGEVVVYLVCKTMSTEDLNRVDQLTVCVTQMEEIKGTAGKEIRKVILAASCEVDIRLQAEKQGIHVLTKDELFKRRNTPIH
jgi:hypothetical protein